MQAFFFRIDIIMYIITFHCTYIGTQKSKKTKGIKSLEKL